jgi:hypothetical protein
MNHHHVAAFPGEGFIFNVFRVTVAGGRLLRWAPWVPIRPSASQSRISQWLLRGEWYCRGAGRVTFILTRMSR